MPWLITMVDQPTKRPFWRDKLPIFTTVSLLGVTYEEISGTMKYCCRDHQLAVAY
jgi:hypothetical protein